ncbi:MAG: F0F1 ATP synthase subunit B [Muribaculaceae bacterium]|nr:F0F1 ATP synthase subunit B [Muribaculaceae bacterium]MDE6540613.1 F0F1 ATP synthase subunit B [Muribaculaceae bacterium]
MELFTPDFGLVFWMFVAFGVLFLILWKFAWPVILKSVDSRADLIDKGVEYAQEAKAQLDNARSTADDLIRQAQRQQADMLREADKMKSRLVEEARAAAQSEAQKVMDAAKVSIAQQQKQAEEQLRASVGAIALDIAQKVVQQNLAADKEQRQLVDKLLNEIETQN